MMILFQNIHALTMQEVDFAITEGIRNGEGSCFINVRSWNQFIQEYQKGSRLKRQQKRLTEFEIHQESQKHDQSNN